MSPNINTSHKLLLLNINTQLRLALLCYRSCPGVRLSVDLQTHLSQKSVSSAWCYLGLSLHLRSNDSDHTLTKKKELQNKSNIILKLKAYKQSKYMYICQKQTSKKSSKCFRFQISK